jgi:hypothetical protein
MNIAVYSCLTTDRRDSKRIKLLPHTIFPDADWWLWLDWGFRLVVPPERLVDGFEKEKIVGFKHRFHDCAYAEHAACARMGKGEPDLMRQQIDRYRRERFPEHFGLIECGVLLRRNCPEVVSFNERWWREVEAGSSRDQLSFGYAVWDADDDDMLYWSCWDGTVFENEFTE